MRVAALAAGSAAAMGSGNPYRDTTGHLFGYNVSYSLVANRSCGTAYIKPAFSSISVMEDGTVNTNYGAVKYHGCHAKCSLNGLYAEGYVGAENTCIANAAAGYEGNLGNETALYQPPLEDGGGDEIRFGCFCAGYCQPDWFTDEEPNESMPPNYADYCTAPDDENSDAICGDRQTCEVLCSAVPDCYGFEMASVSRCYLLQADCQEKLIRGELTETEAWDYVAKMDPDNRGGEDGCPLGQSIRVSGLGASLPTELEDTYEFNAALELFESPGTGRVAWSHTGCGWVVDQPIAGDGNGGPATLECTDCLAAAPGTPTCCDDHTATNFIFGQSDSRYDQDICTNHEPWLTSSYCQNTIFEALCPKTCEVACDACTAWKDDNARAACLTSAMLGVSASYAECNQRTVCAELTALNMCVEDPVVQRLCTKTCQMPRRLGKAKFVKPTATQLRERMFNYTRSFQGMLAETISATRRLGNDLADPDLPRKEMVVTWDPTNDLGKVEAGCNPERPYILTDLEQQSCYNLHTFHDEVLPPACDTITDEAICISHTHCTYENQLCVGGEGALAITRNCSLQSAYSTHSNQFCDHGNLDLQTEVIEGAVGFLADGATLTSELVEMVRGERCYAKCHARGTLARFDLAGAPSHCEGSTAAFNVHSNALCVTRERCEELCSMLDGPNGCGGIEVHKTRPRCYLNKRTTCTANGAPREDAMVTSDEYDFAVKTEAAIKYDTHAFRPCEYTPVTARVDLQTWLNLDGLEGLWLDRFVNFTCTNLCPPMDVMVEVFELSQGAYLAEAGTSVPITVSFCVQEPCDNPKPGSWTDATDALIERTETTNAAGDPIVVYNTTFVVASAPLRMRLEMQTAEDAEASFGFWKVAVNGEIVREHPDGASGEQESVASMYWLNIDASSPIMQEFSVMSRPADRSPNCAGKSALDFDDPDNAGVNADSGFCATREQCEFICAESPTCAGFRMFKELPRCELFSSRVPGPTAAGITYCKPGLDVGAGGVGDYLNTLFQFSLGEWSTSYDGQDAYITDYVTKFEVNPDFIGQVDPTPDPERYTQQCHATVVGHPNPARNGIYSKQLSTSDLCLFARAEGDTRENAMYDCYVKADGTGRVVWANQPQYAQFVPEAGALAVSTWAAFCHEEALVCPPGDRTEECLAGTALGSGWILEEADADGAYHPMYLTFPNGTCPSNPTSANRVDFMAEVYPQLYRYRPDEIEECQLSFACTKYPICPELTTCVLAKGRFATELGEMRGETDRVSLIAANDPILDNSNFHPKIIISVERAEAFIAATKWQWTTELYRNVPGGTRVVLRSPGVADKIIISMASVAGTQHEFVKGEFVGEKLDGTADFLPFEVPEGHDPWYTDAIRVQAFDATGAALTTNLGIELEIYAAAAPSLKVFRYDIDCVLIYCRGEGICDTCDSLTYGPGFKTGAAVTPVVGRPGFFTLKVDQPGHFVGTTETRCPVNPDVFVLGEGQDAVTITESFEGTGQDAGAMREPVCTEGWKKVSTYVCVEGSWRTFNETLGAWELDANPCEEVILLPEINYYRLSHRSRMDYGWRISEIEVYSDDECATQILRADGSSPVTVIAEQTSDHYPRSGETEFIFDHLVDGRADTSYWSRCLNCNPYAVDETHGDAVVIDFTVEFPDEVAQHDIRCVRVAAKGTDETCSRRQYFPCDIVLYRGWKRAVGGDLSVPRMTDVMGWTEMWQLQYTPDVESAPGNYVLAADADPTQMCTATGQPNDAGECDGCSSIAKFSTICGTRNLHVFGELLSYQDDVPSSCHCKQMCIDAIAEGCRSWKYNLGKTCFLQRDIKRTEGGDCNDDVSRWISGDTGLRLTGLTPDLVAADSMFSLSVLGVTLPQKPDLHDTTASRQRIKIVDADAENCADASQPSQVSGVGCSGSSYCAPKPSASTSGSASWSDISIAAASTAKRYKVCYNKGYTYDRYSWFQVPGELQVSAANYTWSTDPNPVLRSTPTMSVTVSRPPFSTYTDASNWRIKLIRDFYDCNAVSTDQRIAFAGAGASPADSGAPTDYTGPDGASPDYAVWAGISLSSLQTERRQNNYTVCFSDQAGEVGSFFPVPNKDGSPIFTVEKLSGDSSQLRDLFTNQKLSGRSDQVNVLKLQGFRLHLPSASRIGLLPASSTSTCQQAEVADFGGAIGRVDTVTSTEEAYDFSVPLPFDDSNTLLSYSICYCDAQNQASLSAPGADPEPSFIVRESIKATAGVPIALAEVHEDWRDFGCYEMCSRGCTGRNCFCSGYQPDLGDSDQALCLTATLCRDACEATATCRGFETHTSNSRCILLKQTIRGTDATNRVTGVDLALSATEYTDDWNHWSYDVREACKADGTFSKKIGTLVMTSRPFVNHDWVLEPNQMTSLEVLGTDLDEMRDRVVVIDCKGTCGVSNPTQALSVPDTQVATATTSECCGNEASTTTVNPWSFFNLWVPVNDFSDAASADTGTTDTATTSDGARYNVLEQSYCPGNMDITTVASVRNDQCYNKCTVRECQDTEDESCNCDGHYYGYDTESSNALCLTEAQCKEACRTVEGCYGIDMHRSKPRCFLNTADCRPFVMNSIQGLTATGLSQDLNYDFHYKRDDIPGRRLEDRRLQLNVDNGWSWGDILRYRYLKFRSGGTFTACFCDGVHKMQTQEACSTAADYNVKIGTIHVSGVSCLVKEARFQRGVCCPQFWGGLRCYSTLTTCPTIPAAATTPATPPAVVPPTTDSTQAAEIISTWCAFGPEEYRTVAQECQPVAQVAP